MRPTTARCLALIAALVSVTCSRATPVTPTPVPNVASINVGVLGTAPALVQPGQAVQLFALATDAAGATIDVTNLAKWSSANSATAVVSAGGLVTGIAEGTVVVTATYGTATGTLETSVKVLACAVSTLSPLSRIFSPMAYVPCSDDSGQYGERVTVTVAQNSCTWSAASDVTWITFDCYSHKPTYSLGKPGSGSFSYDPDPNNTPAARTGHLIVTFGDGSRLVHTVTEEAPGCSYMVNPTDLSLPKSGGSGSFDVTVTPATCQWSINPSDLSQGMIVLSSMAGTGSRRIDYQVLPNTKTFLRSYAIGIVGPNALDPVGRITIKQAAQ